jgi:hypothetical protein
MIEQHVIELVRRVRPLGNTPVQIVPASEEELLRFELVNGVAIPNELKSWFRRCNGASVNPGGLNSLFAKDQPVCLDWYFREYPVWKTRGWWPIGTDGCGDLYILTTEITIPSTGTHPVCFLDQSDFEHLAYVMASGLWRFLYFLLEKEVLLAQGRPSYWPWEKDAVLAVDPGLAECRGVPLPWEGEDESAI